MFLLAIHLYSIDGVCRQMFPHGVTAGVYGPIVHSLQEGSLSCPSWTDHIALEDVTRRLPLLKIDPLGSRYYGGKILVKNFKNILGMI